MKVRLGNTENGNPCIQGLGPPRSLVVIFPVYSHDCFGEGHDAHDTVNIQTAKFTFFLSSLSQMCSFYFGEN